MIMSRSDRRTKLWDGTCSVSALYQHSSLFPEAVGRDRLSLNAAAERRRRRAKRKGCRHSVGHVSAPWLSSSSGIPCTHRLRISHRGREGRVSEGCDEGQWLRLPYLGWRQKQRHESPIKPAGKGQLSIQRINLKLADFQEEIRWRDAGGTVSRREMFQSTRDERED